MGEHRSSLLYGRIVDGELALRRRHFLGWKFYGRGITFRAMAAVEIPNFQRYPWA
jgi:hypothetical protein